MMIRTLDDRDASILATFLDLHIETSIFLRSNSIQSGLTDADQRYHGVYVGAFEDDALVAVAAHYWNGMVILQAPRYIEQLVKKVMEVSSRPLAGVIGPLAQALEALSVLGISRDELSADSPEILYSLSLDALTTPPSRDGQRLEARLAREADLPLLIEWTIAYDQETLSIAPTSTRREQVRSDLKRKINEGTLYVMSDHDALVSKTGFNSEVPGIVQIGGVWTPPSLRGRGYARTIVARHLITARDRGIKKSILFTAYDNLAAQKAYESLGFERIGDYAIMILKD